MIRSTEYWEYYTKSFNWKLLSACHEDKTLTVQCIFVARTASLPQILTPAFTRSKHISVMFYEHFCYISGAKYLEKKAESLEKLNSNLASELRRKQTVRIHANVLKSQITLLTYANSVHFFLTELQQT